MTDDKLWVGKCPKHDYVREDEDELAVEFPNKAECECGRPLESVRLTTEMRLKELVS